jgi:transposase
VKGTSGNGSATCCYFGPGWPTYYTWLRRYEEEGSRGLEDHSSAPDHMPTATSAEVLDVRGHDVISLGRDA